MPVYEYCPHCARELEVIRPMDVARGSEPHGGNIKSTTNRGIASMLRDFWSTTNRGIAVVMRLPREVDVEIMEDSLDCAPGADQRIWYPRSLQAEQSDPATSALSGVHAPQEQARRAARMLWPRSNFEWFLLVTVVQALTVVPLVWILAVTVF